MNSLPSAMALPIALDLNCTDNGHACSMARWAHLGAVEKNTLYVIFNMDVFFFTHKGLITIFA